MVVQGSRSAVPNGFVEAGPGSPDTTLSMRVALVTNDMSGLEQRLYAVSTPGSADYGNHLSKEDVCL